MNTYLGFDYGTTNVAVGIISEKGYETELIKFESKLESYQIHMKIIELVRTLPGVVSLSPTCGFIEGAFKGPNSDTYKKMVKVGHSIDIGLSRWGVVVDYVEPSRWRKALFNQGNKKKEECQEWAYERWPFLLEYPKSERGHRADALCIAEAGKILTEGI